MKKLIALIFAMVLVAGTAYAADWSFYGSARIHTFMTELDIADVDDYEHRLAGNSRIGARVKVSDELSGRFEYGSAPNRRLLYGQWNFGAGKFLVGQDYAPLCMFYSGQVYGDDQGLLNIGGVYSGREAMLQLSFGDLKVAIMDAHTVNATESTTPAFEASYGMSFGPASFKLAGGYQTFETAVGDVDTYLVALGAKVNFGPAYIAGNVYTGENGGHLIAMQTQDPTAFSGGGRADTSGATVLDNENMGYILVVGAKINDMFSVEAGYGYIEEEFDGASADEMKAYYLQAKVNLAPGVFVVPEYGVIDAEETGQDEFTYFGAKWQINF